MSHTPQFDPADYARVFIEIKEEYFIKETDKAYCFKLWGKKFIAIPKKLMQSVKSTDEWFMCALPKWFLVEHNLKSIVIDEQKHLFMTKAVLRQLERDKIQQGLDFDPIEVITKQPPTMHKVINLDQDFDDEF